MSGFQLAGRRWWLRGYLAGRPHPGGSPIHSMVQGLPRPHPECILGTNTARALQVPVRQWRRLTALRWSTRSDNGHYLEQQLCRYSTSAVESSGLNWMTKLSWTAMRCYRRVSFVMCFRRSVQLRGRALEEKGSPLVSCWPGRQDADDWLNFMLSQKNLWPTFTTRGTLTEEISEQVFSKERRRLQARHLWMVVKLRWGVLADRMYVKTPTGKSKKELDALLFDRAARRNRTDPYEEKKYRGPGIKEVQAWWKQCQDWMAHFKEQGEPFVLWLQEAVDGVIRQGSSGAVGSWCIYGELCKKVAD